MEQKKVHNSKALDLGQRKVSVMNFSKVVTLPKPFTDNYLDESMAVQVTLSADGRLTLTPIHEKTAGGTTNKRSKKESR